MARFQSRLFNWIDNSLPAQLGRRARSWYEQVGNPVKQAADSVRKNTTKAILYPVYILASSTNLRSKSQSKQVPLLLKPVQSLVLWIDRNHIFAIEKVDKFTNKSEHKSNYTSKKRNSPKSRQLNNQSNNKAAQSITQFSKLWLGDPNQSLNPYESEDHLTRIQKLIKDAIAYFFGKKSPIDKLKPSPRGTHKSTIKSVKTPKPWLTMADVFDDDGSPWPPPAVINYDPVQAIAKQKLNDQINDDLLDLDEVAGKLVNSSSLNSPNLTKSSSKITSAKSQELDNTASSDQDYSRPLYAWIETPATFLGYVYSPFLQLITWLDQLIANLEKFIIKIWQQLASLVCKFLKL